MLESRLVGRLMTVVGKGWGLIVFFVFFLPCLGELD
jgi:hypothetical protein